MGWLYGIPDFSLGQNFTYFNDLLIKKPYNSDLGYLKKRTTYWAAYSSFSQGLSSLSNIESINQAIDFLRDVAQSERQKEISAVKLYCKKNKEQFPFLEEELTEENILKDPEGFYLKLTATLNKARLQTKQYIQELKRIQANVRTKTGLQDYFKDDYRYRLSGDLSSFLKKIIGTYQGREKNENTYANDLHQAAFDIIKESNLLEQIQSNEDFAAISSAILIDLEKRLQEKFDSLQDYRSGHSDLAQLEKQILEGVKRNYLDEIKYYNKESNDPIIRAISDIHSDEFLRITYNVKTLLGIKSYDVNTKKYEQQIENIKQFSRKRSSDTKEARNINSTIKKTLDDYKGTPLNTLTFKSLKGQSIHGNIFEIINSIFDENGIGGGKNAVDLFTIACDYEIKPDDKIINEMLQRLIGEVSSIQTNASSDDKNIVKDLRNVIKTMNDNINTEINRLETLLESMNKESGEFFVFHESLKLYSSIETQNYKKWGGHAGFTGRSLNILTAIDFIYAAAEEVGIMTPASRELLAFMGLNLANGAVGNGNSEPLENYFSIFAGMLMFDDVVNMAKEARNVLPQTTVKQVHLYNLNGVYVPASMVLSYVYDATSLAISQFDDSYGAKATISYNGADSVITNWLNGTNRGKNKDESSNYYTAGEWSRVGAAVASSTKVTISFMAAFLNFINQLSNL